MKVVIPGGSGQVGTLPARALSADGHEVVVLSRNPGKASWRVVGWDAQTLGDWTREIEGADVVINMAGAVNLAAPEPLPNAGFMRDLRQVWGIGFGLPAPRPLLEIGAFFLRTETELILKSRRVIPERLTQAGFTFQFPDWPDAARDLCRQWRKAGSLKNA